MDAVSASPAPTNPGGLTTLHCVAHDPDGVIVSYRWTAVAGAFPDGSQDLLLPAPGGDTVVWQAPTVEATYTITCTARDNGGVFGGSASGSGTVDVVVAAGANLPPRIDKLVASQTTVMVGETVSIVAKVSDPEGDPVAATWTSSDGTVNGALDATPLTVTWTAPARAGRNLITLSVRDAAGGVATSFLELWSILATPAGRIEGGFSSPRNLALLGDDLVIVDQRLRRLTILNPLGQVKLERPLRGDPISLAGGDRLAVGLRGEQLRTYDRFGRPQGLLGSGFDAAAVTNLERDPDTGGIFVVSLERREVLLLSAAGAVELRITACGSSEPLVRPVAARRNTLGEIEVVQSGVDSRDQVCVFGAKGGFLRSFAPLGAGAGKLTQASDLTGEGARTFVVDTFQGEVRVFDPAGVDQGSIGRFGAIPGKLNRPQSAVVDAWRRLFVASTGNSAVEVYRLPGWSVPVRPGDADFDGMADAWELAHGLRPGSARDFAYDLDGDGLLNLEEYEAGTDPSKADTDGDGVPDPVELAAGQDPLDPADNRPVAVAGPARRTAPDLISLSGAGSIDPNGDPLTYRWRQVTGPAPVLEGEVLGEVLEVPLRTAGVYDFGLTVADGGADSPQSVVQVEVEDVGPLAAPGPGIHALPVEEFVWLPGTLGHEANGDPLSATWLDLRTGATASPDFTGSLAPAGRHPLQLTVSDGFQTHTASVEVLGLLRDDQVVRAEVLGAPRVGCQVIAQGESVTLRTAAPGGGQALWEQVEGPPLVELPATGFQVQLVPPEPGVYRLKLQVERGGLVGTPASVCLLVDAASAHVPRVVVEAPAVAQVLDVVAIDAGGSIDLDGDLLECTFEQLEGPRVVLRPDPSGRAATFRPLWAGRHRFAVRCSDGLLVSNPVEVMVAVDAPDDHLPRARASVAVGKARVGQAVVLSMLHSTDADGDTLAGVFAQTRGPWVRLLPSTNGGAGARRFVPPRPGIYAFELWVHDGTSWGVPHAVEIEVGPRSSRTLNSRPSIEEPTSHRPRVPERVRRIHQGYLEQKTAPELGRERERNLPEPAPAR